MTGEMTANRRDTIRLHRAYRRMKWAGLRQRRGWRRGCLTRVKRALRDVVSAWQDHKARAQQLSGAPQWRQLLDLAYLAARYGFPGETYYRYGLFDRRRWPSAWGYVHHDQILTVLGELNGSIGREDTGILEDKRMAWRHFSAHDVPTVPVLLEFDAGEVTYGALESGRPLPSCDLFTKSANLWCGLGAERWHFDGTGYRSGTAPALAPRDLIDTLRERSRAGPLILQTRLYNHETLAALSGGGLNSLRVITGRDAHGSVHVLQCVQRISVGPTSIVDNFAQGGLAAPVDVNGRLGPARTFEELVAEAPVMHHPDTGAPIAGTQLPRFSECLDLAKRAHRSLPGIVSVGWDVVITPTAVVVIEGNPVWGVRLAQAPGYKPLGDTCFAACMLDALDRARHAVPS